jgi:hypothetical protein
MCVKQNRTSACALACLMSLAGLNFAQASTPSPRSFSPAAAPTPSSADVDTDNPYGVIIDRNVFRLVAPPPPAPVEQKPVDLPKVNFNGTFKIGGNVRVLFCIPAKDAKSHPEYLQLAPGEKQDGLELVKLYPDEKQVDVLVSGTAETLSVNSNTASASPRSVAQMPIAQPGPQPAPNAGGPIVAGGSGSSAIVAGGNSGSSRYGGGVTVAGGGGSGVTSIGGNNSSSGGVSISGGGNYNGGNYNNGAAEGGYNGGGVGGSSQYANTLYSGVNGGRSAANPGPALSPDEQALAIAAQYTLGASGHGPAMPPPPPAVADAMGLPSTPSTPSNPQLPLLPGQK